MRKPELSHRVKKVTHLINSALVEALRKGKQLDVRLLDYPITITNLKVSADLKIVNCYFLPFNTKFSGVELLEALNSSKFAIRSMVTKFINLKYSPDIRFYLDQGFENLKKVEAILKSVNVEENVHNSH
ncbi:MAG: ribosome-binding factor A [Rickettsiaceae bacterium]|nr:MAG: ribosome-binding factor A [Rickettsiaceae bacterium]